MLLPNFEGGQAARLEVIMKSLECSKQWPLEEEAKKCMGTSVSGPIYCRCLRRANRYNRCNVLGHQRLPQLEQKPRNESPISGETGGVIPDVLKVVIFVEVNIFCDGSIRRAPVQGTKRLTRAAFSSWISDSGHYWADLVYARNSHDAEICAVMMAVHWALEQGYKAINVFSDDYSIIQSLTGKQQGKDLNELIKLIMQSEARVSIQYIPRSANREAHHLCSQAFDEYVNNAAFPRTAKKKRSYLTVEGISKAKRRGWVKDACLKSY